MRSTPQKALFVPLYTEWFRKFEDGTKTVEYRKNGPRWNERTCTVGRRVVLAHGYGWPRMQARVASISYRHNGEEICIHLADIKPMRRTT